MSKKGLIAYYSRAGNKYANSDIVNLHLVTIEMEVSHIIFQQYACPTKPFKAIYVEGNPVNKIA